MAVNWNSRFGHSMWVQRPWQEMKETAWTGLAAYLSCCLGLHLYTTNGALSQTWRCLLNRGKGSHLPPGTTKLGNLRDSRDASQLPMLNQIFRILLLYVESTQGCQKCDRVHRDAMWIGGLSHQSSDLSCLCNPPQKVVICALLNTGFKGM